MHFRFEGFFCEIPKRTYAVSLAAIYLLLFGVAASIQYTRIIVPLALLIVADMVSMFIVSWKMEELNFIDFIGDIFLTLGVGASITFAKVMPVWALLTAVLCIGAGVTAFFVSKHKGSERVAYNVKTAMSLVLIIPIVYFLSR